MSRTPSRASTPNPSLVRSPPSRLAIAPPLRPSPSLSNLRVHSHNAGSSTIASIPPVPPLPPQHAATNSVLDSSASSVANLDLNEGILIQDIDAEVDTISSEEGTAIGQIDATSGDDQSKQSLRDQLRRTLSHRPSKPGVSPWPLYQVFPPIIPPDFKSTSRSRHKGKSVDMDELALKAGNALTNVVRSIALIHVRLQRLDTLLENILCSPTQASLYSRGMHPYDSPLSHV